MILPRHAHIPAMQLHPAHKKSATSSELVAEGEAKPSCSIWDVILFLRTKAFQALSNQY